MPTKPHKKVATAKPQVRFYIAEDLRQELNGKVSAIGLYTDNVVVLPLPENIPEPTESTPILIKSLGFLFNFSNLTHATTISIDIKADEKRKPFMQSHEFAMPGTGQSINMVGVMQPCVVTFFGERTLIVTVGESVHTFNFEIRRAPLSTIGAVPEPKIEIPKIRNRALAARKKTAKVT
ncbi:hypothetical protein [Polaromonas sp.]|uniref:hypothetical protein n=1 Tax=Polaromonas sp. TaxID=1869339 RepID=UPI002FC6F4DC